MHECHPNECIKKQNIFLCRIKSTEAHRKCMGPGACRGWGLSAEVDISRGTVCAIWTGELRSPGDQVIQDSTYTHKASYILWLCLSCLI